MHKQRCRYPQNFAYTQRMFTTDTTFHIVTSVFACSAKTSSTTEEVILCSNPLTHSERKKRLDLPNSIILLQNTAAAYNISLHKMAANNMLHSFKIAGRTFLTCAYLRVTERRMLDDLLSSFACKESIQTSDQAAYMSAKTACILPVIKFRL